MNNDKTDNTWETVFWKFKMMVHLRGFEERWE